MSDDRYVVQKWLESKQKQGEFKEINKLGVYHFIKKYEQTCSWAKHLTFTSAIILFWFVFYKDAVAVNSACKLMDDSQLGPWNGCCATKSASSNLSVGPWLSLEISNKKIV